MQPEYITQIVIALIALTSSVIGAVLGYMGRTKKQAVNEAKREQNQADLFTRLFSEMDDIKKRLDTHNKYAEKFGDIEKSIAIIKKDIEYIRKDKI